MSILRSVLEKLDKSLKSFSEDEDAENASEVDNDYIPPSGTVKEPECPSCKGLGCCFLCDRPDDYCDLIGCSDRLCRKWLHQCCDNLTAEEASKIKTYYCPICREKPKCRKWVMYKADEWLKITQKNSNDKVPVTIDNPEKIMNGEPVNPVNSENPVKNVPVKPVNSEFQPVNNENTEKAMNDVPVNPVNSALESHVPVNPVNSALESHETSKDLNTSKDPEHPVNGEPDYASKSCKDLNPDQDPLNPVNNENLVKNVNVNPVNSEFQPENPVNYENPVKIVNNVFNNTV